MVLTLRLDIQKLCILHQYVVINIRPSFCSIRFSKMICNNAIMHVHVPKYFFSDQFFSLASFVRISWFIFIMIKRVSCKNLTCLHNVIYYRHLRRLDGLQINHQICHKVINFYLVKKIQLLDLNFLFC